MIDSRQRRIDPLQLFRFEIGWSCYINSLVTQYANLFLTQPANNWITYRFNVLALIRLRSFIFVTYESHRPATYRL